MPCCLDAFGASCDAEELSKYVAHDKIHPPNNAMLPTNAVELQETLNDCNKEKLMGALQARLQ
jgi:hypothetical protein